MASKYSKYGKFGKWSTYVELMSFQAYNVDRDLSEWDVSSVTSFSDMFQGADSLSAGNQYCIATSWSSQVSMLGMMGMASE